MSESSKTSLNKNYKTVNKVIDRFLLLAAIIMLWACAADDMWLTANTPDYGFPTVVELYQESNQSSTSQLPNTTQAMEYPNISGYWLMKHTTYKASMLPVLQEEVTTKIEATLLVEITQDNEQVIFNELVCDVFMLNEPGFGQMIIPDAFIQSLKQRTRKATLFYTQNQTADSNLLQMRSERYEEFRGVNLNSFDDPMPADKQVDSIIDADQDGQPGLTVQLIGFPEGDVYLIQKMWDRLLGNVVQEDLIQGVIEWEDEQLFLGATNEALLIDMDRWIPGPAERHQFVMQRVDEMVCPARMPAPTVD